MGDTTGTTSTGDNNGSTSPSNATGAAAGQEGATTGTSGSGTGDHLDQLLNATTGTDGGTNTDTGDTGQGGSTGQSGGDNGGQGDPQGQQGQQSSSEPMTRADFDRAAQALTDRTVNAVLNQIRRQGGGKKPQQPQQGQQGAPPADDDSQGGQNTQQGGQDQQSAFDTREARMAFREYFNDRHRPVDPSEREIAHTLGSHLVAGELAAHGDPDRAARTAAETVAGQLDTYRKAVEAATVAKLRQRGALIERTTDSSGGGSAPAGTAPPAPSNLADKRSAAAQAAERINTQLGHPAANAG